MKLFHEITHVNTHRGRPTVGSLATPLRVYILDRLLALFQHVQGRTGDMLFLGFETRFPDGMKPPPVNCLFLDYLQGFLGCLRSAGAEPVHAWSRDTDAGSDRHRYSWITLADALPGPLPDCALLARDLWLARMPPTALGASQHLVVPMIPGGIRIRRDDPGYNAALAEAHRLASRLAIHDTKYAPPRVRTFACTHI
jgi:hypothetical protein